MKAPSEEAFDRIMVELHKAEAKFPGWPDDVVHGAAIMAEESGEAVQAALDHYYRPHTGTIMQLQHELAQTGAMCIRMLTDLILKSRCGSHYDLNATRIGRDCG